MASPKIQWRATDPVVAQALKERTPLLQGVSPQKQDALLSDTGERDLTRYYKALLPTLYAINLQYGEAMLIVDALNGYRMTTELPQLMVDNVEDAMRMDGLDEKWKVDRDALIEKMRQWTPLDCLAVIDAVERWWNTTTYYQSEEQISFEQRCIQVGLLRVPRVSLDIHEIGHTKEGE